MIPRLRIILLLATLALCVTHVQAGATGLLVQAQPAAVVWQQGTVTRINLFAWGVGGRLEERWWNGTRWRWTDHGFPPLTKIDSAPAAVTWNYGGTLRINVFARGADGTLIERWWDGSNWHWTRHGPPPNSTLIGSPGTIVAWTKSGTARLNLFVIGMNGRLYERWWDGSLWRWTAHGQLTASGFAQNEAPALVAWSAGGTRLNLFTRQVTGQLVERWWSGSQWSWTGHGRPPGTLAASASTVVAWRPNSQIIRLNLFLVGANNHLIERWWNGSIWQWTDHGLAPASLDSAPEALVWQTGDGIFRLNVFARGGGGKLLERWWDGSAWRWTDHGVAPAALGLGAPQGVTWRSGSTVRLNVFAVSLDGQLIERWWDGATWRWTVHGYPPA